ncbi:Peptidoglycan/xylan/chitin deacetylase, PgdA/CDA1 family [Cyclobacterium xiamenense]|uniref:Peptidoglycan/xylan/chitin deacetylase, PgdA/CDA1 family n=1 Tax=Cyclobacterium xiamenense TaxID=1297121 RepID=A0A1H6Z4X6_9BACT|nr:polysaccharide deacetylase family protein [Cyclobacterium xiamenense]SEJ48569.1 Peptidoglycan/xylan/chitin deacetylase, PgdA/CDA1 family [Cyclobacterium xiamenense]
MRPFKVPDIAQQVFTDFTWHRDRDQRNVFLTFDDGPVDGVTDFVLEALDQHRMKATFFMVGDNVSRSGSLARQVWQAGHGIGNHTFHHLRGAKTSVAGYLQDVERCGEVIRAETGTRPTLFRPPYGSIRCKQKRAIKEAYEIVLWDLISWDFVPGMSPKRALRKLQETTRNGSIVLFHDQQKSRHFLKSMLHGYLDYLSATGYTTQLL